MSDIQIETAWMSRETNKKILWVRLKEQQFRQHGEQISEFREELRQQALGHDKLTAELLQKRLIEVSRVA